MAEITSTYSDRFYDVENKVYQLVIKHSKDKDRGYNTYPGTEAALLAIEMVKVFAPIHEAFVNYHIGRPELVEWLMQLNATPIEISEIIEEMEANRNIVYDARKRITQRRDRPTGE